MEKSQKKAVALISGGLDSLLAARAMQAQGIHVEGLNFYTGFCVEGHTHAIRKKDRNKPKRNNALWSAEQLGIKLHIIDIIEEYKDIVINPSHGYGAHMNPCLDCKGFMVAKANEWRMENGFDFIITGEVIGQRPMSQRRETMPIIQQESGAGDRLLRPLCAKNLPPTLPEREGWVNREALFGFSGRSRKPQIALAKEYGFEDFSQPAGGCCFLTDENYSNRLADLWQARGARTYELDDIMLLKMGRHLRPRPHFKLIIGREEGENRYLEGYRKRYIALYCKSHRGPLALLDGEGVDGDDLSLAAQILSRYSQGREAAEVDIVFQKPAEGEQQLRVKPLTAADIPPEWLL